MKAFVFVLSVALFGTSLAVDPRCSGVPSGEIFLFSYPGDCTRYIECTIDGEAVTLSCPDGQYFNEALQACDHPETSGCVPLTCPPGVVDYFSYPGDCSRYVECYRGKPEVHECPANLFFNAAEKRCVSAATSGCGEYSTTREPDWTTPHHAACWGVLPGIIELKPIAGTCTSFIECIGSQATILYCPPGLYFDSSRQMCDQPDLADCDATTGTPDPSTPEPVNPTDPPGYDDPRCANGNTDYWEYVECSKFIECYGGHGYLLDCPSGLYFDEETKKCIDPSLSGCGRTTRTPDPYTTIPSEIDPDCPWPSPDRYLFPFPGDCTKFLECVGPVKVVQDCPYGLFFNPTILVCDYPYEAGCRYAVV